MAMSSAGEMAVAHGCTLACSYDEPSRGSTLYRARRNTTQDRGAEGRPKQPAARHNRPVLSALDLKFEKAEASDLNASDVTMTVSSMEDEVAANVELILFRLYALGRPVLLLTLRHHD